MTAALVVVADELDEDREAFRTFVQWIIHGFPLYAHWHRHLEHAMIRTPHPRDFRDQDRSVLAGIQVAPATFSMVIAAAGLAAFGTGQRFRTSSIDEHRHFLLAAVQLHIANLPRGPDPEDLGV